MKNTTAWVVVIRGADGAKVERFARKVDARAFGMAARREGRAAFLYSAEDFVKYAEVAS